jgi:hypothetical protein
MARTSFINGWIGNGIIDEPFVPIVIPWDPLDCSGVVLWEDQSDPANVTQAGGEVSVVGDKSAPAYDLVQASGSFQPDINENINSISVLRYDGTEVMIASSVTFPASGNMTFYVMADVVNVDASEDSIFSLGGTNAFQLDAGNSSQFNGRIFSAVSSVINFTGGPYDGAPAIFAVVFDFDNTTITAYVNGTQVGQVTDYNTKLDAVQDFKAGANATLTAGLDCRQGEPVVCDEITPASRQLFEGYYASKYTISAVLPNGHPFKLVCPDRTLNYIIDTANGIVTVNGLPTTVT